MPALGAAQALVQRAARKAQGRSGERTIDAGIALEKAGFTNVVNVLDGFEGDRDDNGQRSTESGWRFEGLPWTQS